MRGYRLRRSEDSVYIPQGAMKRHGKGGRGVWYGYGDLKFPSRSTIWRIGTEIHHSQINPMRIPLRRLSELLMHAYSSILVLSEL